MRTNSNQSMLEYVITRLILTDNQVRTCQYTSSSLSSDAQHHAFSRLRVCVLFQQLLGLESDFSSLGAALKVSLTNVDADLKRVKGSIDIMNIEEAKSRCVCGFPFPLQSMCDTTAASCGGASAPRFPCSCDTTTAPIHLCSVRICPSIVRMLTETLRLSRSLIERTCPVPK